VTVVAVTVVDVELEDTVEVKVDVWVIVGVVLVFVVELMVEV